MPLKKPAASSDMPAPVHESAGPKQLRTPPTAPSPMQQHEISSGLIWWRCRRALLVVSAVWILFVSGGATCVQQRNIPSFPPPPQVFSDLPSREELVRAINRTDAVTQLSTNSASIQDLAQNTPKLSANVHLRRDRDLRLRAKLPIVMGSSLDIGSNADVFWFEVPDGMTRRMFFARHDQFQGNLDRAVIPVNPAWLIEAIGLVHIDPNLVIAGPVRRQDGLLEIRSHMPDGIHQRVCYVDQKGGFVTQQLLTKPLPAGGEVLVAESRLGGHRYDETAGCVLPHTIQIRLISAVAPEMHLRIEVGEYAVNQLLSSEPDLFVMPQTAGTIEDLNGLSLRPSITKPTYVADRPMRSEIESRLR